MPRKYNFTIHKIKKMTCGHEQTFSTPVPRPGDHVWCNNCNDYSRIPRNKNNKAYWTVAQGRPRRLKENPRSNNQYTKGRKLADDKDH